MKEKRPVVKLKVNLLKVSLVVLAILLIAPFFLAFFQTQIDNSHIDLSNALEDLKDGKVDKVSIEGDKLTFTYKDKSVKVATKEDNISFPELLNRANIDPAKVNYSISDQTVTKAVGELASIILPLLLMGGLLFLFLRSQNKGAQDIFSFGRSRAKLFSKGKQATTFKDVAGVDEAKKELSEVVDFLKHPAKYRAMGARTPKGVLLFGPAGVGKCVTGDTLVWTNKGLIEIKDVPKYFAVEDSGYVHGASLASFDPESPVQTVSQASHWYDLGISDTIKLQTDMGHQIEGTPEHPLVVLDTDGRLKFKRLQDIKTGDSIAIKTDDQMFGNYKFLDTKTSYLLGLLAGDGGLTQKDRIYFSTADKELLLNFKNYFKEKFGYEIRKPKSRKYDYEITSSKVKNEMINLGMEEVYARHKKVPDYIMMAPKENVVAFLQGLFDTDGSVYKSGKVEYCTTSEKMARQVSSLLLNLGIMHKFRVKGINQYSTAYVILISGTPIVNFAQQVGFRLKRKQEKLDEYIGRVKLRTNVDLVRFQGARIKRLWRHLVESGKKPSKFVNENFHKQICRYAANGRSPNMESVRLFLQACKQADSEIEVNEDYRYLRLIVDSNIFIDKVKMINKSQSRVYDFTVPKTHSFISNGFVSHNTLLARAVAGEAGVPFFSMAGSEFMEMLVGVGASRVRDLFSTAKAAAPSIIFIDEIDAIGRQRGRGGYVGGHDEREQTLNQILVEMDGFTPNDNVIVIAATNRGDLLDPALLRPGRFDRRITLDMPDKEGRLDILKIHAKGKKFSKNVKWERVSDRTVGFSGADLENMLNEAAIHAARGDKHEIEMEDIEEAATKVKMGPARHRLQSKEDREITAYHEAGHAIVTHILPKMDPVHRISIVARGMSLGHTLIPPAADRTHETKSRLLEQIAAMLGGRAAEEVIFGDITAGASNDIEHATRVARAMVVDFGMSNLGPVNLGPQVGYDDFGNANWMEPSQVSPAMQEKIDIEVRSIMEKAHKRALIIVKKNKKLLDKVVTVLLEKETIDRDDFEKIVGPKPSFAKITV